MNEMEKIKLKMKALKELAKDKRKPVKKEKEEKLVNLDKSIKDINDQINKSDLKKDDEVFKRLVRRRDRLVELNSKK